MTLDLQLSVNGRDRRVTVPAHHTLLEVLRADLRLTGTKECCLVGECGACTVLLDGRSVDSCLVLAAEAAGRDVVTVEGLAGPDGLDPLQQAFLDHGAAQCGFCIPGQLMAARALLATNPSPTRADVEEGLAGNLCRCAGYEQIIEATLDAAARQAAPARDRLPGAPSSATHGTAEENRLDPAARPDAQVAPQ
ncbi:MAG TPA: (2Fe-2S)-binding protein [Candidatus Limnocylindrales bacterium]|nr:(2Fe-2S)-binding protein [Candidatus Limnocylindrales bacterium]